MRAPLAVLLALVLATPSLAATPPGASSPEALVERLRAATAAKDLGEVVACLTPKARAEMSAALFAGAAMIVAFSQMGAELGTAMDDAAGEPDPAAADKAAEARAAAGGVAERFAALLRKYDLADEQGGTIELEGDEVGRRFAALDHGAFVTDVVAFMDSLPGEESASADFEGPVPTGELRDLVVDGDRAAGTIDGETVRFVRIDGRWYAEPDEDERERSAPEAG